MAAPANIACNNLAHPAAASLGAPPAAINQGAVVSDVMYEAEDRWTTKLQQAHDATGGVVVTTSELVAAKKRKTVVQGGTAPQVQAQLQQHGVQLAQIQQSLQQLQQQVGNFQDLMMARLENVQHRATNRDAAQPTSALLQLCVERAQLPNPVGTYPNAAVAPLYYPATRDAALRMTGPQVLALSNFYGDNFQMDVQADPLAVKIQKFLRFIGCSG
ncbi:hypothetical protein WJX72_005557 [[Myrmecia] bisecta]|uniref:Uncharacterized protein n=1 Tax=[Myrmecia] bisecta TaxID=41462 RepID=A0AAW1PCV0_9CHLO